ncbi:MAG TPA: cobalamin-dependent protein, partial [bacterium]
MKILLIQPPVADFYQTSIRTLPVGLLYLASALRQNGFSVELLDCQATEKKSVLPLPTEFAYLQRYYRPENVSPYKLYGHFRHYGLPWDEIRERIRVSRADIVGVSSLFTPFYREALRVAAIAKELDSQRPVILGGAHVNACPEQVLSNANVDFVLLGEGERTLPALVAALTSDKQSALAAMPGIGYKVNGRLHLPERGDRIDDLDALALPARDLIDPQRYTIGGKRLTMLVTSRGCPYRCTFCSIFLTAGRQYRTRSIPAIIDEMKLCRDNFGVEIFDIEDDNFTFDQKRARAILSAICEEFGGQPVELLAMNGITAANISEPMVEDMKRAGFRALNLALVTSDRARQRATKRPGSTSHFDRVVQKGAAIGIEMVNYLILGLPGSTVAEMIASIVFLMARPVLIGPSVFYATPGTESYRQCEDLGLLTSPELALQRSTCFPVETPEFSRLDLLTLFRLCRFINFIKSRLDAQPSSTAEISMEDLLSPSHELGASPQNGTFRLLHRLTEIEIGCWLAPALLNGGTFLGMSLLRRESPGATYSVYEEEF